MNKELLMDAVSFISDDTMIDHFKTKELINSKKAQTKRQARAYLRLLPIAAAMLALVILAVAVLPGMIKGDDPAGTESKFLSITDIPGAVVVDCPTLTNENTITGAGFTAISQKSFIEALKATEHPVGIGTMDNIQTVLIKGVDFSYYITIFDVHFTKEIKNIQVGDVKRCASVLPVHPSGYIITYTGAFMYFDSIKLDPSGEYMYALEPISAADPYLTELVKNETTGYPEQVLAIDLSKYADYFVSRHYMVEDDSFYYNGKIGFDEIIKMR